VVGLTILIVGVVTSTTVGPVIEVGAITTTLGTVATSVTGYRALHEYVNYRVAHADSAALVAAVVQHDTQFDTAPSYTVVEFDAARRTVRENAT
jgi:hypothetical protein